MSDPTPPCSDPALELAIEPPGSWRRRRLEVAVPVGVWIVIAVAVLDGALADEALRRDGG